MTKIRSGPALAILFAGVAMAQDKPAPAPAPKSPQAVIADSVAKAKAHNKRALVVFEQHGSKPCAVLAKVMQGDRDLSRLLKYEFDVATVDAAAAADAAKAHDFLTATTEVPALLVLDADGKALAKLTSADFFDGDEPKTTVLIAKLREVQAAPLDAGKVLAAGLAAAKETDRRVFLRFDAPW